MDILRAYQIAAAVAFVLMTTLWATSLTLKDASIVDRFWGGGFALIAGVLWLLAPTNNGAQSLITCLVIIWGARLSLYIHFRNRGHGEDYRYQEMRAYHGPRFWWYSYLSVFLLQGALMVLIATPILWIRSPEFTGDGKIVTLGFIWWLTGFVFEAGADFQLSRFKQNTANRGKLLDTGFWSLSRHPNYFGDALQWWGLGIMACQLTAQAAPTLLGPMIMTYLIRKISGVDLLEKNLKSNKPGYDQYVATTPAFAPGPKFWVALLSVSAGVFIIGSFITQER